MLQLFTKNKQAERPPEILVVVAVDGTAHRLRVNNIRSFYPDMHAPGQTVVHQQEEPSYIHTNEPPSELSRRAWG